MNCDVFAQMLDRYADLSEIELTQLEEHAAICDNCRAELEFMQSIISTAQSLPPIEPPHDFLDTLNARLDKEIAAEPKIVYFMRQAKPYINRYGTIAACVAVGIVIGANGNMLVSRMNDNGDGVISETTTITDNSATPVTDNQVIPQITPEAVNNSIIPPVEEAPAVKQSDAAATVKNPSSYVNTQKTASATQLPKNTEAAATAKPVKPAAAMDAPAVTTAPVVTDAPVMVAKEGPTDMPAEDANAGIMVASLDMEQPSAPVEYRSIRMIDGPEETPEIYAEAQTAAEVDVAAEYSIATVQSQSEAAYVAPLSSTLTVKAEDEARAKEIIMGYVEATYGNYYMITGDKLYSLTLRLESEGIWYQANITDSGVKVSFKLVTM